LDAGGKRLYTAIREQMDLSVAQNTLKGEKQVPVANFLPAPAREVGQLRAKSHEPKINRSDRFNNPADSVLCLRNLCIEKTRRTEKRQIQRFANVTEARHLASIDISHPIILRHSMLARRS